MRFRGLTFGTKILLSFAGVTAMLALTAALGWRAVMSLETALDRSANVTSRKLQLAGAINSSVSDMSAGQLGQLLFSYTKDPARAAESKDLFQRAEEQLRNALAGIRPLLVTD